MVIKDVSYACASLVKSLKQNERVAGLRSLPSSLSKLLKSQPYHEGNDKSAGCCRVPAECKQHAHPAEYKKMCKGT